MATADEILAAETGLNNIWFEVDLLSRQIIIPKAVTNLGVKNDKDVMHARFKLPRFYYGVDFSEFKIGIDYTNAEGEEDRYEPKDVVVSSSVITFTWVVGRHAALYEGNVTFGLCAKRLNPVDPDDPNNEFHTIKTSLPILDGMETCEQAIIMHTDLLEQWREQLFGEKDSLISDITEVARAERKAIEDKGIEVLATIPADYQTAVSMTDNADRSKADAIICTAEGEIITVADSSDDYLRGLRIFGKTTQVTTTGKNLLNADNMATFLNNMSSEKTGVVVPIEQDGQYTYYVGDSITVYIGYSDSFTTPATHHASALKDKPAIGTITLKAGQYFMLWFDTGVTVIDKTKYSLAFGTDVTYEPYSGGKPAPSPDYPQELASVKPTVVINGKNLFDINSLRVTLQADGGYLLPQYPKKTIISFPDGYAGQMTISGWVKYKSAENRGGFVEVIYTDGTNERVVGIVNSTLDYRRYEHTTDKNKLISEIAVSYGVGTVATYFKDMQIEFGTVATAYEPYSVQTATSSYTLPAIPVSEGGNYTDANGQQWICDEIDFERGVYVQRVCECELTGNDRWVVSGVQSGLKEGFTRYDGSVTTPGTARNESLWSHFQYKGTYVSDGYGAWVHSGNDSVVGVRVVTPHESVEALSEDLAAKYAAGTPVKFQYVLATPVETPLTTEEIQWFRFAHTNSPNTTVLNDFGATMQLKYNADTEIWTTNNAVSASRERVNDTVITDDFTWSSKAILDKLCPAFEKSGSVVTCESIEGYPMTVVAEEGATITRCGKNLCTVDSMELSGSDPDRTAWSGRISFPVSIHIFLNELINRGTTGAALASYVVDGTTKYITVAGDGIANITSGTLTSLKIINWGSAVGKIRIMMVPGTATPWTFVSYTGDTFVSGEKIPALVGINTLYSDSGDITVTGRSDLLTYIKKLEAAITNNET